MDFDEILRNIYDEELAHNPKAYENLPDILERAVQVYTEERKAEGYKGDMGQSLRATTGPNIEKLLLHILTRVIDEAGLPLALIRGASLENQQTDPMLGKVKRNILVDFGIHGCFLPDADIIVYDPTDASVKAIISCKISLRERIAQTGYWKLRLRSCPITQHIKMFFLTSDRDNDFEKNKITKRKAIVLHELDAAYILRENLIEQYNIRKLERIKEDLQGL